jgi:hypothetical protein
MIGIPVGSDATLDVPFVDLNGDPVTPTGLAYAVYDGEGVPIVELTPIADLTGTHATITVPAGLHAQPGGYSIQLFITVGSQTFIEEVVYGVFAVNSLVFLKNSFQTFAQAFYLATNIPNLTSITGSSKKEIVPALIEAFDRITKLNFVIPWPELLDMQSRIAPHYKQGLTPLMWPLMTEELFAQYPENFRKALCKAQVVEANQILTGDSYASRRRAGLMSESVGESSMMFKAGVRPLDLGMSREALDCLTGFLNNRITTTRA